MTKIWTNGRTDCMQCTHVSFQARRTNLVGHEFPALLVEKSSADQDNCNMNFWVFEPWKDNADISLTQVKVRRACFDRKVTLAIIWWTLFTLFEPSTYLSLEMNVLHWKFWFNEVWEILNRLQVHRCWQHNSLKILPIPVILLTCLYMESLLIDLWGSSFRSSLRSWCCHQGK